jgi:hypothetical protein
VEKILEYTDLLYNIVYINIDDLLIKTLVDVEDFKVDYHISSKNFKHIEGNIVFHYIFTNIINLIKEKKVDICKKTVFYTTKRVKLEETPVLSNQLKAFKKIFPLPIIFNLDESVFMGPIGSLVELNQKTMNFYGKRKIKLKDIKKYLDDKGFYNLTNTLSSTIDLKGIYY